MVDRLAPHRDPLDREHRKALDFVVVAGVIAERAFGGSFIAACVVRVGMDESFEDDLGRCRHLEIVREAIDDLGARAAQQSRELIFGQRVGHRRHRAENRCGIGAEHDGDRKRLARIRRAMIAKVERAAAHAQPAHDHLVARDHLLPVDAEILSPLVGTARDGQSPRDQRRDIARPTSLNGQAREIDIGAFPHDVLAIGAAP